MFVLRFTALFVVTDQILSASPPLAITSLMLILVKLAMMRLSRVTPLANAPNWIKIESTWKLLKEAISSFTL